MPKVPATHPEYEQYKKSQPQFKLLQSTLLFSEDKTLFFPTTDNDTQDILNANPAIEQRNIVYTNLEADLTTTQKDILGSKYLVKDHKRKIQWKITGEVREIDGYMCRRANAIIMDSLYVVAFYTDEILPEGGPESFSGLPGMILGVVLPHENISWFAKKIEITSQLDMFPPKKGKIVNNEELANTIFALNKKSTRQQKLSSIIKFLLL